MIFSLEIQFIIHDINELAYDIANENREYKRLRLYHSLDKLRKILETYVCFNIWLDGVSVRDIDYNKIYEHILICGHYSDYMFKTYFWKCIKKEFNINYPTLNLKTRKDYMNYFNNSKVE